MKTYLSYLSGALALCLTLLACNKESLDNVQDVIASEDLLTFQNMMEETDDQIEYTLETRGGDEPENDCPIVTVTPDDGTYPRTILIDFGTEGCEGPHGRIRTGLIQITLTDALENPGAIRTVEHLDYYVDDVWVQGTKTLTNTGLNADGLLEFTRTITGGSLTFPNGDMTTFEVTHTVVEVESGDPDTMLDNVYHINGGATGTNRNGDPVVSQITQSLVKKRSCRWIVEGTREVTVNDKTRTVDYGDGTCDRKATVTLPNGNEIIVLIRRWW
jgi:hypothetical protein